jgi:hypothetical protein
MILKLSERRWVNSDHVAVVEVDSASQVTLTLDVIEVANFTVQVLALDVDESRRFLAYAEWYGGGFQDLVKTLPE